MTLYERLSHARSEEDVKDYYIKALGLKSYTKGLIDIQTKEVWFEAKDTGRHSIYAMFTQLLHYVQVALNKGDDLPGLLAVIDTEKAAIMQTSDVIPFLAKKTIKWGKSATKYSEEALAAISSYIGTHFVAFQLSTHEDEFVSTTKAAIKTGKILRTQITPDNLKQVFDKWVSMIGEEITGAPAEQYALLFFADIMHDGTVSTHQDLPAELLHRNGAPVFLLEGKLYNLASTDGYRRFWSIYHKPPAETYRNYLLERRDVLIPLDERIFHGGFYTKLQVVDKAYDLLSSVLGKRWQQNYLVWDMCCGVGNLEVKHSNPRNLFMSTLDQADVDVMRATRTCVAAERFQYDYLNDDVGPDGVIDYTITNKIPQSLRDAIQRNERILVLINPPYAEAANNDNTGGNAATTRAKVGVATTKVGKSMTNYGYARRELFAQFLARISRELPTATVAVFSTLKYINSPNFSAFRENWNATYLGGFIVHSRAFDGLTGNFPIGFLIWRTDQTASVKTPITEIRAEMLTKDALPIGEKILFNTPKGELIGAWIDRPRSNNVDALPLKNALTPATPGPDVRGTKWADGAIGSFMCKGSDLQNAPGQTALFSSGYGSAGALFVTSENLPMVAVAFAVRLLVKHTWMNHNDQFLRPTVHLPQDFTSDCLVWMLFHGKNLSAGADGIVWQGRPWALVNHFVPYTEAQVGASGRFESDFMSTYLGGLSLSVEANDVLDAGRALWKTYFNAVDSLSVRRLLHLNRPDAGWYQVRNALRARIASGSSIPIDFAPLTKAHKALAAKLIPQVYDLGFLRMAD